MNKNILRTINSIPSYEAIPPGLTTRMRLDEKQCATVTLPVIFFTGSGQTNRRIASTLGRVNLFRSD